MCFLICYCCCCVGEREAELTEEARVWQTGTELVGPCPLLRLELWEEQHQCPMSIWDSEGKKAYTPLSTLNSEKIDDLLHHKTSKLPCPRIIEVHPVGEQKRAKRIRTWKRVFTEGCLRCRSGPSAWRTEGQKPQQTFSWRLIATNHNSPVLLLSR